jgi:hypothetical protein
MFSSTLDLHPRNADSQVYVRRFGGSDRQRIVAHRLGNVTDLCQARVDRGVASQAL